MANTFSFDIVSNYNVSEMNNAVDQTERELANRYDLKGTKAALAFRDANKSGLTITGDNQYHVEAIIDILRKKMASRGVSLKVLDTSKEPLTNNMKVTLDVPFKKGLDQEKAKQITTAVRNVLPKVKTQIQGDEVRVTSSKKDELQAVIKLLEAQNFTFPLEFINYR